MSTIGPPPPPKPPIIPTSLRGMFPSQLPSIGGAAGPKDASGDFAKLLLKQFDDVNAMQTDADDKVHDMLTGGNVNQAEVLTAVQKADLAFRMMLQVRNKLIEAYRELQQIQI